MRRATKLLWVLVFWVALPLGLAEAILRVSYAVRQELPPTLDASLEKEWRWAERHLAEGRATLSETFVHDSQLGWRVAGARVLRGAPARRRMLFVGDSYTYGQGVEPHETFAHRLSERLQPDWEVLNLAAPGYGTDQQVLSFETAAASFGPDVVVLGFYVRDYRRNLVTFRDYAKPMFALDGEGLRLVNTPVIAPEALFEAYVSGERVGSSGSPRMRRVGRSCRGSWRASRGTPAPAARRRCGSSFRIATSWRRIARTGSHWRSCARGAAPSWRCRA
jgi:hypothetical protein